MTPFTGCIYCGSTTNPMSEEHIFPKKLGGRKVLKGKVCELCNNTVLSRLDSQLITHSPLSFVAFRELKSGLRGTWEVNEHSGRVLISAEPVIDNIGLQAMRVWPQIMLDDGALCIYGTEKEMKQYGSPEFNRIVVEHTKRVLGAHNRGQKSIIWEKHSEYDFHEDCKYPPRIYLPCKLDDRKRTSKMIVSYVSEEDKNKLLHALEKMPLDQKFNTSVTVPGSKTPLIVRAWYPDVLVRALAKIGINLLSHLCTETPINRYSYPAINYITGATWRKVQKIPPYGFVPPRYAEEIKHPKNGHAARLVYFDGIWTILFSFFGNEMAAIVQIPGLSSEDWCTADVSMDLKSKRGWKEKKSNIYVPISAKVEWDKINLLCPSLKSIGTTRMMSYEAVRVRRKLK